MEPGSTDESNADGQICLRGTLILAAPVLRDPNFSRTVLLLTEHSSDDGAHGFVLNRPLDKRLREVLPSDEFSSIHDVPVYVGGPVSPEQLTFASLTWSPTGTLDYRTHLSAEDAKSQHAAGAHVRAFVGYAGWSGGQLESELQQHAWITSKPLPRATDPARPKHMWTDILESMGPYHALLARTPDDPSLN